MFENPELARQSDPRVMRFGRIGVTQGVVLSTGELAGGISTQKVGGHDGGYMAKIASKFGLCLGEKNSYRYGEASGPEFRNLGWS